MEYGHAQAVADGVNVNYDVYRIQTEVSEQGCFGGLLPKAQPPLREMNLPGA